MIPPCSREPWQHANQESQRRANPTDAPLLFANKIKSKTPTTGTAAICPSRVCWETRQSLRTQESLTNYPKVIPDSCRASLMRNLSFSHVPDSGGASELAICWREVLANFPPAQHDIHNIDITHKLRRTFLTSSSSLLICSRLTQQFYVIPSRRLFS